MLYILTEGTYASNECIAFEDVQFSLVRSANRFIVIGLLTPCRGHKTVFLLMPIMQCYTLQFKKKMHRLISQFLHFDEPLIKCF